MNIFHIAETRQWFTNQLYGRTTNEAVQNLSTALHRFTWWLRTR